MNSSSCILSGYALTGEDLVFLPVDIVIENGTITAIEDNVRAPQVWICPAFFNAHTHLADTIAMDCGATGDLAALVTPPNGLKHRLLRQSSRNALVAGMQGSIRAMISSGTCGCADFREGGPDGVAALKEACMDQPFHAVIFGREGGESVADGLGISSARDVPDPEHSIAAARRAGKMVGFHAGEQDSDDVDAALAFDPDFIVHATHATRNQIRQCADRQIPIVICPRSNWILGVTSSAGHPPVHVMEELGCTIYIGTDNVMFVPPDMPGEMAFVSTVYKSDPRSILKSAIGFSSLAHVPHYIRNGARANLLVIDPEKNSLNFSRDPVTSIVKRISSHVISKKVFNS